MADAGFHRLPLTLDPTAQEFRPMFPYATTAALPLIPNHIYYSFPAPAPAPVPPAFMNSGSSPALPPPSTVPTRALLLSSVSTDVSESSVRRELEVFGDVRAVQMERLRDGIVTVYFYDLRQATEALKEIQGQHMQQQYRLRKHFDGLSILSPYSPPPPPLPPPARGLLSGRAIWAQFTFPVAGGFPDAYNQGTIVVFNLDSDVSTAAIKEVFEAFGCVKEIKDKPLKKNQKLVEFYDTRDAAKAVASVNGQEVNGKQVVVEFSRHGGHKQNKLIPINPRTIHPPPVAPYRPQPLPPTPCSREGNNVISPRVGLKKTGKNLYKHQPPPEKQSRWVAGGDGGRNKLWKESRHTREKTDFRFLIKEDAVISSFCDSRTTVMIKNIPNKYSQKLLLNMLDNHCIHCNEQVAEDGDKQPLSSYDFAYLPIDFVNKCNVGYGFVNMTSPEATWRLYKSFHHQNWEVFNSKKICEVSYARLQGLEALKEHFKNSKFPREAEEYMPVVFTPPRDGRALTEPMPIIGRSSGSTTTVTSSSSSMSSEVGIGHDLTDVMSCSDNLLVEDTKSDATITTTAADGGNGDNDGFMGLMLK